MDSPPQYPELPRRTWIDRIQALFEVLLISGILSSLLAGLFLQSFHNSQPFNLLASAENLCSFLLLESIIAFAILGTILLTRNESISSLGVSLDRWPFHCLVGLAIVPLLFLLNALVAVVFQTYFPQHYLKQNPLAQLIQTPRQLALVIFSALIAGGIKEELQRAFILMRFKVYLGGGILGLALWSIGFGLGHYVQGIQGIVTATIFGLIFGVAYLQSGSLIAPIVAHSAYDSIALISFWLFASHTH